MLAPERPVFARSGRGFTLIELLVVIAIISLMTAILLPSLGRARDRARILMATNQMRQQIIGWTSAAGDQQGTLPRATPRAVNWGPNTWRDTHYGVDLSRVMTDYGFINASSHPVVGAPTYDDPAFAGIGLIDGPWAYFPGWQTTYMTPDQPQPNIEAQPVALHLAEPENIIMQETMQFHRFSKNRRSLYPSIPATVVETNGAPRYFLTNGPDPEGTHVGRYDGSIAWREFEFNFFGPNDFEQAHIGFNWITAMYLEP